LLNFRQQGRKISQKEKNHTNASDKIDKVMDSTGAGDAFGLDFYLLISSRKNY
jgi:sugar/nucleoside kinase (ribokinase family)